MGYWDDLMGSIDLSSSGDSGGYWDNISGLLDIFTPKEETASTSSWFFDMDDEKWDPYYDAAFDLKGSTDNDSSWFDSIWKYANSELGVGIIGGAADAYLDSKSSGLDIDWEREKLDKTLDFKREELALGEAELEDKITTRKKHNESINAGPQESPKKITFGAK
jgi:hypothetical protein